jgi:hypothetical protein
MSQSYRSKPNNSNGKNRFRQPVPFDPATPNNKNPYYSNHYNYVVSLRLAPVENGIECRDADGNAQQFIGLNAFKQYFDYLLPDNKGSSLPDVWDGYFHITLGKFRLNDGPSLEQQENHLVNYIKGNSSEQQYASVFPCKFQTEKLEMYTGEYRHDEAEGIDYVTLIVQARDDNLETLRPFLSIIKRCVQRAGGKWEPKSTDDYLEQLHVTVRKYKDDYSKWSSEFIQNCGVSGLVRKNPLTFECIALDITQTRRQARKRNQNSWWIGVTGISLKCTSCRRFFPKESPGYCPKCDYVGNDHECSECKTKQGQISWDGYCPACEKYERLRPLWSTKAE